VPSGAVQGTRGGAGHPLMLDGRSADTLFMLLRSKTPAIRSSGPRGTPPALAGSGRDCATAMPAKPEPRRLPARIEALGGPRSARARALSMDRLIRIAMTTLLCTSLLGAAEDPNPVAEGHRDVNGAAAGSKGQTAKEPITFSLSGRPRFIMRRVRPPEGGIDFRILGEPGAPPILSLISPDADRYADYTFNGSDADIDVSHGGLNLRPLDGVSGVNVWSMAGNTQLRVGSRGFSQALDFWHSGINGYIRSTTGKVIVQSPFETRSVNILGGDTFIKGVLRTSAVAPASSSSTCEAGQIVWDADYIYVCAQANLWKRAKLELY
jgi:hypothetical protein